MAIGFMVFLLFATLDYKGKRKKDFFQLIEVSFRLEIEQCSFLFLLIIFSSSFCNVFMFRKFHKLIKPPHCNCVRCFFYLQVYLSYNHLYSLLAS